MSSDIKLAAPYKGFTRRFRRLGLVQIIEIVAPDTGEIICYKMLTGDDEAGALQWAVTEIDNRLLTLKPGH